MVLEQSMNYVTGRYQINTDGQLKLVFKTNHNKLKVTCFQVKKFSGIKIAQSCFLPQIIGIFFYKNGGFGLGLAQVMTN